MFPTDRFQRPNILKRKIKLKFCKPSRHANGGNISVLFITTHCIYITKTVIGIRVRQCTFIVHFRKEKYSKKQPETTT